MDDPASLDGGAMTRPVIYIAGPYSFPDPPRNVHRAVQVGTYLMDHGLAWPLVPHLSMLWDTISPRPYADWLALDFALLERCDGLVRLAGTSTGADGETDWCNEHGVPWIALTDAWAADSSLGLRAWIEGTWPTEEQVSMVKYYDPEGTILGKKEKGGAPQTFDDFVRVIKAAYDANPITW